MKEYVQKYAAKDYFGSGDFNIHAERCGQFVIVSVVNKYNGNKAERIFKDGKDGHPTTEMFIHFDKMVDLFGNLKTRL